MTSRRHFLASLLLVGDGARAQAPKAPLVGVLVSTGLSPLDYLRLGMKALGYVEGRNVRYAFRSADGDPSDLPGLARHLVNLEVDVLFCAGPAAVGAAPGGRTHGRASAASNQAATRPLAWMRAASARSRCVLPLPAAPHR